MSETVTINNTPGLVSGPNSAKAYGSLRRAINAAIIRPNIIEHKRSIRQYAATNQFGGASAAYVFQYKGTLFVANSSNSTLFSNYPNLAPGYSISSTDWTSPGSFQTINTPSKYYGTAEANGNCYLCYSASPWKMDALFGTSNSNLYPAGIGRATEPTLTTTAAAGGFLPVNATVAYRILFGIRDANNNFIYGVPSGRATVTNGGSVSNVTIKEYIPARVLTYPTATRTSVFVQVYRSAAVTAGDPGDELQLVYQQYLTSTDFVNAFVQITDLFPEGVNKGAFLYTNASQQGAAAANYPPPPSKDIAFFKGAMWFGSTNQFPTISVTMLGIPDQYVISTGAGGITKSGGSGIYTLVAPAGTYDLTGILTDGTAKLSATGCTSAGNNGDFVITAVNNGAQTITVTNAGAVTEVGAAAARCMVGTIKYDSGGTIKLYNATYGAESIANKLWNVTTSGTVSQQIAEASKSIARVISRDGIINVNSGTELMVYYSSGPDDSPGMLTLQSYYPYTFTFTLQCYGNAFGLKWARSLEVAASSTNDAVPGRLYYSKYLEPEHVPLNNYFDVGVSTSAIVRIVPIRDSLFVFKEDGLFRVTGDGTTWTVARFDDTIRLPRILSACVAVLRNKIYAMTTRGLLEITELGSRVIDEPVVNTSKYFLDPFPASYVDATFGTLVLRAGATVPVVGVSERDNSVYFFFSTSVPGLIYNIHTGAWTQFDSSDGYAHSGYVAIINGIAFYAAGGAVFQETFMPGVAPAAYQTESAVGAPLPGNRYMAEVTAINDGANQISITYRRPGSIVVSVGEYIQGFLSGGDLIALNKNIFKITAVSGSYPNFTLTLAPTAYFSGSTLMSNNFILTVTSGVFAEVIVPVLMTVEYQPFNGGDDHVSKRWIEVAPQLDLASTTSSLIVGVSTEIDQTEFDQTSSSSVAYDLRTSVDVPHQRSERISVVVKASAAITHTFLRGVSYAFSVDKIGRVL